jgi:hypothetical protein
MVNSMSVNARAIPFPAASGSRRRAAGRRAMAPWPAGAALRRGTSRLKGRLAALGAALLALAAVALLVWGWIAAQAWVQGSLTGYVTSAAPSAASAPRAPVPSR